MILKLIKLPTSYIVVSNEEIVEGNKIYNTKLGIGEAKIIYDTLCFYMPSKNGKGSFTSPLKNNFPNTKKITHSTEPLEDYIQHNKYQSIGWLNIKPLTISEIEELILPPKTEWEIEFDEQSKLKLP